MTPSIKAIPYRAVILTSSERTLVVTTDLIHADLLDFAIQRWAVITRQTETEARKQVTTTDEVSVTFSADVANVTLNQQG